MSTAYLDALIARLQEEKDRTRIVRHGFDNPHSYRGDYAQIAFEPAENVSIQSMLDAACEALGQTFTGYKGGEYKMDGYSETYLARYGDTGEMLGPVLLGFMLGKDDDGDDAHRIRTLEAEVERLHGTIARLKRVETEAKAVDAAIQFVRDGSPGWLGVVAAHDALRAAIEGSK